MLMELQGCPKPYAWGSRTAIPELFGWSATDEPFAELWLGTHPAGPATVQVDGAAVGLDAVLAARVDHASLGALAALGSEGLPFLLKVLAAEQALSLQVHPSAEHAAAGFAAEEAAGVPIDAAHRRYRDPNPKAELVVALGEFRALAGVREPVDALAVVEALGVPDLVTAFAPLAADPTGAGVRTVLAGLLGLPAAAARALTAQVQAAAAALLAPRDGERVAPLDGRVARYADLVRVLGAHHDGDIGIVASVLLHDVSLQAGQALYQPTGSLHAYVSGLALELMVSSDNVLRGGLTCKHMDVDELLAVWDPTPAAPARADLAGPMSSWAPDGAGFALHRLSPTGGSAHPDVTGPALLLATAGTVRVEVGGAAPVELGPGQAVLAPDATGIAVTGHGTCYLAATA